MWNGEWDLRSRERSMISKSLYYTQSFVLETSDLVGNIMSIYAAYQILRGLKEMLTTRETKSHQ